MFLSGSLPYVNLPNKLWRNDPIKSKTHISSLLFQEKEEKRYQIVSLLAHFSSKWLLRVHEWSANPYEYLSLHEIRKYT